MPSRARSAPTDACIVNATQPRLSPFSVDAPQAQLLHSSVIPHVRNFSTINAPRATTWHRNRLADRKNEPGLDSVSCAYSSSGIILGLQKNPRQLFSCGEKGCFCSTFFFVCFFFVFLAFTLPREDRRAGPSRAPGIIACQSGSHGQVPRVSHPPAHRMWVAGPRSAARSPETSPSIGALLVLDSWNVLNRIPAFADSSACTIEAFEELRIVFFFCSPLLK